MTDKYADPSADVLMDTDEDVGGAWGEDADLEIDEGADTPTMTHPLCHTHYMTHPL